MTALKGRPPRQNAGNPESQNAGPRASKGDRSDGDIVKVTTRMTNRQARRMRVLAMEQGISIEEAYADAVEAYIRRF